MCKEVHVESLGYDAREALRGFEKELGVSIVDGGVRKGAKLSTTKKREKKVKEVKVPVVRNVVKLTGGMFS